MKTKICRACKEEYPATTVYFFKSANYKSGLDGTCKACRKEQANARLKNREAKTHKRTTKQPCTKGIGDKVFDYPLKIGKKYKVIKLGLREGQTKTNETFQGELIQITDNFFVLRNKHGFCESFLKNDYLLGEIKILEV